MSRLIVILILLLLIIPPVAAKKLYKFQDEQGRWHFTDEPPKREKNVEVTQLKVDPKDLVRLLQRGEMQKPSFYVSNEYYGAVELEVKFADRQNTRSQPSLPERFTAAAADSTFLFSLYPEEPNRSWGYRLEYRYVPGDPKAEHRPEGPYLPPLAPGGRYPISQAFNGRYTHKDDQNRYAVDIVMPVGTPVHAARGGVVMDVEKDFFAGGTDDKVRGRANTIRIVHGDGTMAVYAHLALERAQVYPGMEVDAGQLIGYSGNTGFTTGPHLHFAVQRNAGMKLESVPFEFLGENDRAVTPVEGMWLTGVSR